MAKQIKVTGLAELNRNIKKEAAKLKGKERPMLTEMVAVIQKTSMQYTPVDIGILMGSHRNLVEPQAKGWVGTIYLLAVYALFVHEAKEGTNFKSSWPKGRKYLDRAFTDKLEEVKGILIKWLRRT